MQVFTLDNGTYGFDELQRAVNLAAETGKGIRLGVAGRALHVAVGQMMWSLPIADLPDVPDRINDSHAMNLIHGILLHPDGWSPDANNDIADVVRMTGRKVD